MTQQIDEFFDQFINTVQPKKLGLNHDPIALSCCAFRTKHPKESVGHSWGGLQNIGNLSDEDNRVADDIRKYYAKKLLWKSLKNEPLTDFQKAVLDLVSNPNKTEYLDNQEGLIYKLPEFYFNDLTIDEIFSNADVSEIKNPPPSIIATKYIKSLRPINVIKRRNRQTKENQYWLKDTDNRLYQIIIPQPNPVEHLWVDLFDNCVTININAHYRPNKNSNGHYYKILDWNLEK